MPDIAAHRTQQVLLLCTLAAGAASALYAYLGRYARYQADDFCAAVLLRQRGFIGAQVWMHAHWDDKYSSFFLNAVAQSLTQSAQQAVPGMLIVLTLLSTTWAIGAIGRAAGLSIPTLAAGVLAATALLTAFNLTPVLWQSLYWQAALVIYMTSLPALALLAGIVATLLNPRARPRAASALLLFSFALLAGGLSETYAALQICVLALAATGMVAAPPRAPRRAALTAVASGLAGAAIALVVMALAPAARARALTYPPHHSLAWALLQSARNAAHRIRLDVQIAPGYFLAALAAGIAFGAMLRLPAAWPRHRTAMTPLIALIAIPPLTGLLLSASLAPSVYATSATPEPRVFLPFSFLLAGSLVAWGVLLGLTAQASGHMPSGRHLRGAMSAILLVSMLGGAAGSIRWTLDQARFMQSWTAGWDARDSLIRAERRRGMLVITAAPLRLHPGGVGEPGLGPGKSVNYANGCIAGFYGLRAFYAGDR